MKRLTEQIKNKETGEVLAYRLHTEVDRIRAYRKLGELEDLEEKGELFGKWIPCSERLPNCIGVYQVTKEFLTGDRVADCAYFDGQNKWHNDNRVNHGRTYLKNVIAWMPLPEPYKGE